MFRHRLPLVASDWQILHNALAVAIVVTAIAHATLLQGTLDGFAEGMLCGSAAIAISMAVIYWHIVPSRH